MHRSRLAGFIIDCQAAEPDEAAQFWSAALGFGVKKANPDDTLYRTLETGSEGMHIEVQKVDHPSRVHLDIEAEDIDAEATRLEALGARRIRQIRTWWVMEAPTGQRFCIVRPQGPGGSVVEGDANAGRAWNRWS